MEIQPDAQPQTQLPSPFFSILVQPRKTIRRIVDTNPTKHVIILAMLAGLAQALERASSRSMGDRGPLILIMICVPIFGAMGGVLSIYLNGAILRWTGSWLGGQASSEEVRAAIAWSFVPTIFVLPLWIPKLLILGEEIFTSSTPRMEADPALAFLWLGFGLIEIILGMWAFALLPTSLSEVHQFSIWKSLGAIFLAALVYAIFVLCLAGVFIGLGLFPRP